MFTNLDYYRIFYYVAKYRNLTRAADALLTSQPTVTRTVKNLENDLGCRLFVRSKRGVALTAEGETLYSYVAPAYERILRGEEKLGGEISLQGGCVYISATETSLHCFLLEKLGTFHDRHPQIRLRITNVSTMQAIEKRRQRKIRPRFCRFSRRSPRAFETGGYPSLSGYSGGQRQLYRIGARHLCPEGFGKISAHFSQPQRVLHLYLLSGGICRSGAGVPPRDRIEYLRPHYSVYPPQSRGGVRPRRAGFARAQGGRNRQDPFEGRNSRTAGFRGL